MSQTKELKAKIGLFYFKKIFFFAVPLMLTGILQSFYNAADLIVVGKFDGELALAAVGSTASLTHLILGVFLGLSVGAGVCVAHAVGARQDEEVQKVVHTSVLLALILGVIVAALGFVLAPQLLLLMDTPEDVLGRASLYVRIIFLGAPASILYNYCAAMLRASGDSKRPLYFLTVAGIVNVVFNVILVAVFHLGVAGVAIATIFSQIVSAVLIMIHLCRTKSALHFSFSKLRIHKDKLKKLLIIGVPSGIQGSLFSLSNVILQSSINSFGPVAMAGNTAASNIADFFYTAYHSFYDCALTFVGQSVGAGQFKRIKKIIGALLLNIAMFSVVLTAIAVIFQNTLLGFYLPDGSTALDAAHLRYSIVVIPHFICAFMDVSSGTLRGMGRSISSTVISLLCACLFRIVWIATVFKYFITLECIYITYPISWALTAVITFAFVAAALKKEIRKKQRLVLN